MLDIIYIKKAGATYFFDGSCSAAQLAALFFFSEPSPSYKAVLTII